MVTILVDPLTGIFRALRYDGNVTRADITVVQDGGPTGAILQVTHAIAGSIVNLTISGGTDGGRYAVTVRAATAAGEAEQDIHVAVLAKNWAMPDGSPGWIDLIQFVSRLGFEEAIAATDESGAGNIDRTWLIAKLIDAQAEVEANIAARYALPLAAIPTILQSAVSDLARARLYRRGLPDDVAENAKTQRRLLERIAKGDLRLPLPAGAIAEAAPTDAPVSGWSSGRTYPNNLTDY